MSHEGCLALGSIDGVGGLRDICSRIAVASIMLSPRFHSSDGVRSIVHAWMERLVVLAV